MACSPPRSHGLAYLPSRRSGVAHSTSLTDTTSPNFAITPEERDLGLIIYQQEIRVNGKGLGPSAYEVDLDHFPCFSEAPIGHSDILAVGTLPHAALER